VNLTEFVNFTCELENTLGSRSFSGVHVSENADVAIFSEVLHEDGNVSVSGCATKARAHVSAYFGQMINRNKTVFRDFSVSDLRERISRRLSSPLEHSKTSLWHNRHYPH
jgi:hypothetical protein